MNSEAYTSLLSALNQAVEILERNRTPNPELIATFDTIKQARAMAIRAVERPSSAPLAEPEFALA